MRLGILSDIHANYEALSAVLEAYSNESIDDYYCLGDTVGYGGSPNECSEIIREIAKATILGNHDAAVAGHLPPRDEEVPGVVMLFQEGDVCGHRGVEVSERRFVDEFDDEHALKGGTAGRFASRTSAEQYPQTPVDHDKSHHGENDVDQRQHHVPPFGATREVILQTSCR